MTANFVAFTFRFLSLMAVFAMMEGYAYKEFGIDSLAIEIGAFFVAATWTAANQFDRIAEGK